MNDNEKALTQEMATNPVIMNVIELLVGQQMKGLEKYGKFVEVHSLTTIEWLDHAMQECADKLIYLECIKQSILDDMKKPLD